MSRFGRLLGGKKVAPAIAAAVNKHNEKPSQEVVHETVVEEVVEEVVQEEVVEEVSHDGDIDLHSMSKRELESYGRTVGIELDRRYSKTKLIEELESHLSNS